MIKLDMASPSSVVEATGSSGCRPAVVLLSGENITSAARFEIDPIQDGGVTRRIEIVDRLIAGDGKRIALALQIPVLTQLGERQQRSVVIKATQFDQPAEVVISVDGLDELAPAGVVNAANLRPLYSRAELAAAVHFSGTQPALIRVVSSIVIGAAVDVDGQGRAGGAGGCDGGLAKARGGCGGAGGGGPGVTGISGSGGGGGGFGAIGGTGTAGSASGGASGTLAGEALLLDLVGSGNRGSGGGGGGDALPLVGGVLPGGVGGGGGGVLELTAGGSISVTGAGRARANGAGGGAGGLLAGGGGGGSGGAVVIRAGAGITAPSGWITAAGGGGAGAPGGGAGGVGRVRIDSPSPIAGMATTPAAVRGAVWATSTPALVATAALDAQIIGANGGSHGITLNSAEQPAAVTDGNGRATVNLTLAEGANQLCVYTSPDTTTGAESRQCIDVVLVP